MFPTYLRLRPWALTFLALWAGAAGAITLDPQHPLWRDPAFDHQSFEVAIGELRLEQLLQKRDDGRKRVWADARMLVLPVYYADRGRPAAPSQEALQHRFFGPQAESVRGFFEIVSGGECELSGTVLDWQRMPEELRLYRNILDARPTSPFLAGPRLLVRDAARVAATIIDLSAFDGDGPDGLFGSGDDDGFVDLLVVLHPDEGFETSMQPVGPAMLAHQSFLSTLDDSLATRPAMARNYLIASAQGPLGVWVHEISHLLGLNDLYDLDRTGLPEGGQGGLGIWSLMAGGTWGGDGSQPSGLDAYSRRRLGWDTPLWTPGTLQPGDLSSVTIEPLGDWAEEHFLVEVRGPGQSYVDAALPGSGALVYHVDPGVANASNQTHRAVRLLQADGRDDLGSGVNDGDATDPFPQPGLDEIDGTTTPSTRSHYAGTERVPPVIRFARVGADAISIDWQLHPSGALRLSQSSFDAGGGMSRAHLLPLERSQWQLRFDAIGAPSTAQLEAVVLPDSLALYGVNPVTLQSTPDGWIPADAWEVEALTSSTPLDAEFELELRVDGAAPRRLRVGIPVGGAAGLSTQAFARWTPAVLSTSPPTTAFEALDPTELPATAQAGFELRTQGAAGYSEFAHCALTSPWFAAGEGAQFQLWSSAQSEQAFDGQAWDGGALELLVPDLGWRPLLPEGGPTVIITPRSEAPTRARVGFGGRAAPWSAYRSTLPDLQTPVRVRLRFGSDTIPNTGFWKLADAGTQATPARAGLVLRALGAGRIDVEVTLQGDIGSLVGEVVALRWRRPHEDGWRALADRHTIDATGTPFSLSDALPASELVATVGLFVEDGADPPLQLGLAGYRAPSRATTLSLAPNPASGEVWFLLETSLANLHLDVYDSRGRQVRSLHAGAPLRSIRWDGRDANGAPVASGMYVVILREDSGIRRKLTWIR